MLQKGRSIVRVEVFLGGAPLLEPKVGAGLVEFGLRHPEWRFSIRGADFKYTRRWLREHQIEGVIVVIDAGSVGRTLDAAGIPWVHLFPARRVSHASVDVDDLGIGRLGADFFMGKGYLRGAFCGVGTPWSELRAKGFISRFKEAGRPAKLINTPFSRGSNWSLAAGAEKLLHDWIPSLDSGTGVMAANDAVANRVVDACLLQGMRVPQQIAVLGVGNHDLLCELSPVPISSVDADVPRAAFCAAEMLKAMIEGNAAAAPFLPPIQPKKVVERRSTEILVYGDDLVARIISFMRTHLAEGIHVDDLVAHFHIPRRTLTRRFNQFVGHSVAAEMQAMRMEHAKRLVESKRMSLTEIAAACGYADLSHMDHAFRKTLGVPPSALF